MNRIITSALMGVLMTGLFASGNSQSFPAQHCRYLVITDMGHDDGNSLIRLLHYANEVDIEAIIVSPQHAPGDDSWMDQIWNRTQDILNAYDQVDENLRRHHPGFPTADEVRAITKPGRRSDYPQRLTGSQDHGDQHFDDYVGEGKDSEGSDFLQTVFEKDDPRPIVAAFWGGPWTFAQAVYRFRQKHGESEATALMDRMIFHCISFQDVTFDMFIDLDAFGGGFYGDYTGTRLPPSMLLIDTGHFWSYLGAVSPSDVHKHGGALSAEYDNGGEGDTPSLLNLVSMNRGLSHVQLPEWGGWGDRFTPHRLDKVWKAEDSNELNRWKDNATSDFFARCHWQDEDYGNANHEPVACVNGDDGARFIYLQRGPSETVELDASQSTDPDGDRLSFTWFRYDKADSYGGSVPISNASSPAASVTVPGDIGDDDIHIVLEVTDNGSPAMTTYRRIVIGPRVEDPFGDSTPAAGRQARRGTAASSNGRPHAAGVTGRYSLRGRYVGGVEDTGESRAGGVELRRAADRTTARIRK